MKFFIKLLLIVLTIGLLLPFTFLKGKDGKPMMSFGDLELPDFSVPDLPDLPDMPKLTKHDDVTSTGLDLIYKWIDAEGNLQFSNDPPPQGVEYTVKGYNPNTNVIQAVEIPSEEVVIQKPEPEKQVESEGGVGGIYSPEKIKKLFEDAENVEKLLNDRMKQQEALSGQ
ncbi:MAG: DUF4124 domain-containing protein [Gammaproteobacteria bacterium]|nr:DUF4124 domain-containing protein [Gammaproteobacteria bacterium]